MRHSAEWRILRTWILFVRAIHDQYLVVFHRFGDRKLCFFKVGVVSGPVVFFQLHLLMSWCALLCLHALCFGYHSLANQIRKRLQEKSLFANDYQ